MDMDIMKKGGLCEVVTIKGNDGDMATLDVSVKFSNEFPDELLDVLGDFLDSVSKQFSDLFSEDGKLLR